MKSDKTIIRKTLMEQFNFITNLLGIKDPNIIILDVLDAGTHKEIIAKLDYPAPKCPHCQGQMAKYNFQKESKIPYLECAGYKTLIRLRKRRFRCKICKKMSVAIKPLIRLKIKRRNMSGVVTIKTAAFAITLGRVSIPDQTAFPSQRRPCFHFFSSSDLVTSDCFELECSIYNHF